MPELAEAAVPPGEGYDNTDPAEASSNPSEFVPRSVVPDPDTVDTAVHSGVEASYQSNPVTGNTVHIDFPTDTAFTMEISHKDGKVKEIVARFESKSIRGAETNEPYSDDVEAHIHPGYEAGLQFQQTASSSEGKQVTEQTFHSMEDFPPLPPPKEDSSPRGPRKPLPSQWLSKAPTLATAQRAIARESRKKPSQPDLHHPSGTKTTPKGRMTVDSGKSHTGEPSAFLTKEANVTLDNSHPTSPTSNKTGRMHRETLKSMLKSPTDSLGPTHARQRSSIKITLSPKRASQAILSPDTGAEQMEATHGHQNLNSPGDKSSGHVNLPIRGMVNIDVQDTVSSTMEEATKTSPPKLALRIPQSKSQSFNSPDSITRSPDASPSSRIPRMSSPVRTQMAEPRDKGFTEHTGSKAATASKAKENVQPGKKVRKKKSKIEPQTAQGPHQTLDEDSNDHKENVTISPQEANVAASDKSVSYPITLSDASKDVAAGDSGILKSSEVTPIAFSVDSLETTATTLVPTDINTNPEEDDDQLPELVSGEKVPEDTVAEKPPKVGFQAASDVTISTSVEGGKGKDVVHTSGSFSLMNNPPVSSWAERCGAAASHSDDEIWTPAIDETTRESEPNGHKLECKSFLDIIMSMSNSQSRIVFSRPGPTGTPLDDPNWNYSNLNEFLPVQETVRAHLLKEIDLTRKPENTEQDVSASVVKAAASSTHSASGSVVSLKTDPGVRISELRATAPAFVPRKPPVARSLPSGSPPKSLASGLTQSQEDMANMPPPSRTADSNPTIYAYSTPMEDPFSNYQNLQSHEHDGAMNRLAEMMHQVSPTTQTKSERYTGQGHRTSFSEPHSRIPNANSQSLNKFSIQNSGLRTSMDPLPQYPETHGYGFAQQLEVVAEHRNAQRQMAQYAPTFPLPGQGIYSPPHRGQPDQHITSPLQHHAYANSYHTSPPGYLTGNYPGTFPSNSRGRRNSFHNRGRGYHPGRGSYRNNYIASTAVPLSRTVPFPDPIPPMPTGPMRPTIRGGGSRDYVGYVIAGEAEPKTKPHVEEKEEEVRCGVIEIEQAVEYGGGFCHKCKP